MTTKNPKDAAGKVLYCEFRKDNYTFQLVISPNYVDQNNSVQGVTKASRRVSTYHPRRNWSVDKVPASRVVFPRDAYGEYAKTDEATAVGYAESTISNFYGNLFNNIANQAWVLHEKPLVVEFTYDEAQTLQSGKLPVSLYRRIERVRKSQGWADSLFNEEEEVA
jgi:hypothetical protein